MAMAATCQRWIESRIEPNNDNPVDTYAADRPVAGRRKTQELRAQGGTTVGPIGSKTGAGPPLAQLTTA